MTLIAPSYAQAQGDPNDFIIQLVPLLLMWVVFAIFGYSIARRKGISMPGIFIGTLPIWDPFMVIWWASKTDKSVLERLNRLEGR